MTDSSTAPPGMDDAADPSASSVHRRGTEGSAPRTADTESAPHQDTGDDFVLDSGAALHATRHADLLSNPKPPEGGAVVRTRVGEALPVAAVGSVRRPRFVVPQVHHAPDLKNGWTAVISVRQLARSGLAVTFESEYCSVKEQSTGAVVGAGRLREDDGFYHLNYLIVPQS